MITKTAEQWLIDEGYAESMAISRDTIANLINMYIASQFPPLAEQGQEVWVDCSDRNPRTDIIDTYHTNIRMKGTGESTFPAGTTFSGEWEVAEDYEVVSWLERTQPAANEKERGWTRNNEGQGEDWFEFVMYLTGYKKEQIVRQVENWKRNVKS